MITSKNIKILAFLGLILAGCYYWISSRSDEITLTTTPKRGPAILAVYATGTVEPSVMIPIAPRNSGRLMELLADEGQIVKKGTILAKLEDSDISNALNDRKATLNLAQKEYDRQERLSKSGATSKQAYDRAAAALESAKANVAEAEANLNFMRLIAPEEGTIIRRDGEIGEMISTNTPVFWMSCCAGLRISAEVDEEDIPLVKVGQPVVIKADAFPGEIFNGSIQSITPKGDPIARSYRVRISLPPEKKLMIGMTAEANIIIEENKNALLIPSAALSKDKTVTRVSGLSSETVKVETGATSEDMIEIRSGLSENDTITYTVTSKNKAQ